MTGSPTRTRDEVIEAFTEAGAAVAGVYDARDLTEDPHVRETQMLIEVDDDDLGPVLQHNVMWRMSRSPGRIRFTGRRLGADTDAVLHELGLRRRGDRAPARGRSRPMTDPLLEAVTSGLDVVDLGRQYRVGMPQSPQPPALLAHAAPPARRHDPAPTGPAPPTT